MTTSELTAFGSELPASRGTEFFVEVRKGRDQVQRSNAFTCAKLAISDENLRRIQEIKDILRKNARTRLTKGKARDNDDVEMTESTPQEENEVIETIRKENVFGSDVTENDIDIIQKRVAQQQKRFAEFELRESRRKALRIREIYDYLSDEEIATALKENQDSEEEVLMRMSEHGYLSRLRRKIAEKYMNEAGSQAKQMSAEQSEIFAQLVLKRKAALKKSTTAENKKKYRCGRLDLDTALRQIEQNTIDPAKAFEGWSEARIKAYKLIETNPNSYYYRFNAPGEVQAKGLWTTAEKKLFHARLDEIGATGQWGLFSMSIPGRVGYQCSNYYRLLLEKKQLIDPNYVLDEKGKAHYLFSTTKVGKDGSVVKGKTIRTHNKKKGGAASGSGAENSSTGKSTRARRAPSSKRKRRSSTYYSDDSENESDGNFSDDETQFCSVAATSWATTKRSRAKLSSALDNESGSNEKAEEVAAAVAQSQNKADEGEEGDEGDEGEEEEEEEEDLDNPLPGFIDPITLDEVIKPAISPYGHVMSYDSWVRCLTNMNHDKRNICPLTKKPLTKRELVVLTHDNIEDFRSKIVNAS